MGAVLLAGLAHASGCIITTDDDDDDGRFFLTWSLVDAVGPLDCAEVGADRVSVLSTRVGTASGIEDIFACEDLEGTTDPLPSGTYTVSVSLLEAVTDAALGVSEPRNHNIFDGEITDLREFVFDFSALTGR
jgi:hypothetical protein